MKKLWRVFMWPFKKLWEMFLWPPRKISALICRIWYAHTTGDTRYIMSEACRNFKIFLLWVAKAVGIVVGAVGFIFLTDKQPWSLVATIPIAIFVICILIATWRI